MVMPARSCPLPPSAGLLETRRWVTQVEASAWPIERSTCASAVLAAPASMLSVPVGLSVSSAQA